MEDRAATFAADPPYEAFRLQLSLMMTGPRSQFEGDDDVPRMLTFPEHISTHRLHELSS